MNWRRQAELVVLVDIPLEGRILLIRLDGRVWVVLVVVEGVVCSISWSMVDMGGRSGKAAAWISLRIRHVVGIR